MEPLQIAGAITGGTAAVAALAWAARTIWTTGRGVANLADDWRGEPDRPGVPGRPGVLQRLARIEGELTLNGGRSLKDAVMRIDDRLVRIEQAGASPVQVNVGMPAQPQP